MNTCAPGKNGCNVFIFLPKKEMARFVIPENIHMGILSQREDNDAI